MGFCRAQITNMISHNEFRGPKRSRDPTSKELYLCSGRKSRYISSRRKGRIERENDDSSLTFQHATVYPTMAEWKVPTRDDEIPFTPQFVVNALSLIFPLDGRVLVHRHWFPVLLLSCFYRRGKLTFIILNRANNCIYNASKFVNNLGHVMFRLCDVHGSRQSVTETLTIYITACHYEEFATKRLNKILCREILQYGLGEGQFVQMRTFLQGSGSCGWFLSKFQRKYPFSFTPLVGVFFSDDDNSMFAPLLKKQKRCVEDCHCEKMSLRQGMTFEQRVWETVCRLPTTISPEIFKHFQTFVDSITPGRLYFPEGDAVLC